MSEASIEGVNPPTNPRRIYTFLILYRWLSLLPPLITLFISNERTLPGIILTVAVGINIFISYFPKHLNRTLRTHPWLLAIDLGLMAGMVAFTGGWRSPYYLHALNPLLAAAFFFQMRGAIIVTTGFLPLYAAGIMGAIALSREPFDWLAAFADIVGFYLITGVFGYASTLVTRLRTARDGLIDAHRDLGVIHDLTVSLQSAADVEEVQEGVLEAVTVNLDFKRAFVGLVDQDKGIITGWLGRVCDGQILSDSLPHLTQIPVAPQGGIVAEALLEQQVRQAPSDPGAPDGWINDHLGMTACRIFPMMLRDHPVGVLLVDTAESSEDSSRLRSLESIASQAAVAIGTTMLCIDRAQRLAVQEERLRIAQDLHDTLSQSLFGIVYTLDGSLELLPEQPMVVMPELRRALKVAEEAHNEVRQSILNFWPSEMTVGRFTDGLRKYVADMCQADDLELVFDINGDFARLSSQARRGLYRIAQEALTNITHHSSASKASVSLVVSEDRSRLVVNDDGHGFDPELAQAREYDREHFGLRGMQQRANTLSGTCEILSQPDAGATIVVDIANTPD
jgi:signal transduction histidine kinase